MKTSFYRFAALLLFAAALTAGCGERPDDMRLLYWNIQNGMWSDHGWQIKEDYALAVRGAAVLFAGYVAGAVYHEKGKSETNDRLVAMGGQALSDALAALGDSDAAAAALAAANELADGTQSAVSSGSDAISAARDTLQTKFNVKIFQLVLLIVAAAAIFMLILSCAMFANHHSKRKKEFEKKQRAARKAAARIRKAAKQ